MSFHGGYCVRRVSSRTPITDCRDRALDADLTTVEDTLHSLERRSILTQLGYSKGNPVYRLHDLHRDFLRERLSDDDRASQHAQAAGYYAIKLAQTRW